MIRRPPRSTPKPSSAASDVYKRQVEDETVEEVFQRCFLGWSASVGRLAFLIETTLVADSDAMSVVVAGVSTLLGFWTAGIDHAILRNVIVVTDGAETAGLVAGFQCSYWEVLVYTCGTAMYHDQIDFSWILHWILWILKGLTEHEFLE